jgi:hypothetical protein
MISKNGIVCGLFKTIPESKVDRLDIHNKFIVKTPKTPETSDLFWGVIKFNGSDIKKILADNILDQTNEIGDILNAYPFSTVTADTYLDLGTWVNLQHYWSTYQQRF